MAIECKIEQGNLVVCEVSGKLGYDETQAIQAEIVTTIQKIGHIRVLVRLKDFLGWEASKGWEDSSSTDKTDPYTKKMALVGDEKWRDLVEVFTLKGLRPVPIEYFEASQEDAARQWLDTD